MRHETGGSVVMNCACHSDGRKYYLVSGQESHCQLYNVNISVTNEAEENIIDSKLIKCCLVLSFAHVYLHNLRQGSKGAEWREEKKGQRQRAAEWKYPKDGQQQQLFQEAYV